jgi:hypothetical protein
MFGVGALYAMAKIIVTVLVLLGVVYWVHKPRPAAARVARPAVRTTGPMRTLTSER